LWAQLLADLRARMDRGEFGEAFPAETDLVESYGVSRNTVREAVRRLRSEGTVVAGRGRRPRLAGEVGIEQPIGALYSLFSSVEQTGLEQRSVVLTLDVRRDAAVARRLHRRPSTPLLFLERLRLAAGEPLAIDQVWFPADLADRLLDVDFTHTGFYDELASRTGIRLTGGQENIRAQMPSFEEQAALGIDSTVAVFAIDRVGLVAGRPVEWRKTVVRGDKFSVVTEFSAGSGYKVETSKVTNSM